MSGYWDTGYGSLLLVIIIVLIRRYECEIAVVKALVLANHGGTLEPTEASLLRSNSLTQDGYESAAS